MASSGKIKTRTFWRHQQHFDDINCIDSINNTLTSAAQQHQFHELNRKAALKNNNRYHD